MIRMTTARERRLPLTARHAAWMAVIVLLFALVCPVHSVVASDGEDLPVPPTLRPGEKISLSEAIRKADAANRELEVLRADLAIAAERMQASWAGLLPTLYGELSYTLNEDDTTTTIAGQTQIVRSRHEAAASLIARMPLVNASMWLGVSVGRKARELANLSFEQGRQLLLYAVAETYYQAAAAQRLIRVYESQALALENHLQVAEARFRSGVGEFLDVKRARTDLVGVRESQARAVFSLEDVRDTLALLIAAEHPPLPMDELQPVPLFGVPEQGEGAPGLAARWDLRVGEQRLKLREDEMDVQWMQFVPTVTAAFQYQVDLIEDDSGRSDDRDTWFLGLTLRVPLFDFGFYPNTGRARAEARQARLELNNLRAEAKNEWRRNTRALRQAEYFAKTARVKMRLADDTLALARIAYANGRGSALTVIDARRSSQTSHVDYETRRLELELARLAYLRSLGVDATGLFE